MSRRRRKIEATNTARDENEMIQVTHNRPIQNRRPDFPRDGWRPNHRIYTEAGPDKLSKMSTRDGSPYTRRKEERREREGDMNDDRLGREADVGDRYRDNNRQSESNYDRNDKSRKSEIERKSTREYDRDYRSSIYHEIGDYKQREAFGREERHSRSLSEHDRTYERDDRPRKDYDVDDRHKRRLN